ncbi:MAG TPA: tetratricopeptide repeat protein [Terriglobales bacterium]
MAANQRAFAIIDSMAKADPQNTTLQLDHAGGYSVIGIDLVILGRYAEGQAMVRQAVQLYQQVLAHDHADQQSQHYIGTSEIWIGEALARTGKPQAASEAYQKGIAMLTGVAGDIPNLRAEAATGHVRLGHALGKMRRTEEAAASYRKALAIAEPMVTAKVANTRALYAAADAYFGLGELSRAAAATFPVGSASYKQRRTDARDWYSKSAAAWSAIPNPAAVTPSGLPCGSPKALAQAVAQVSP